MAGKIIADTLETGAGADIATSYVVNGSAKQWCNFVGSSASVNDSFNTSSVTDNNTGNFSPQLSSSMGNANYNVACMVKPTSGQSNQTVSRAGNIAYSETPTTGGYRVIIVTGGIGPEDNDKTMTSVLGDLA